MVGSLFYSFSGGSQACFCWLDCFLGFISFLGVLSWVFGNMICRNLAFF